MAARSTGKPHVCSECGAELTLRPVRCPLCGFGGKERDAADAPADVITYQDNVRQLRDELTRLRGERKRAG